MKFKGEKIGILAERGLLFKQILLTVFVAITLVIFTQSAFAISLGTANNYNAFIFEDFSAMNSDAEGSLAVGGNVTLTSYSVGSSYPLNTSNTTLIAGGNLSFSNGQINGNVVLGGTMTGGGTVTGTTTQNAAVSIDFAAEKSYLQGLSASLATMTANGAVEYKWGGIYLTGDGASALQVFNIDGSLLSSATYWGGLSNIPSDVTLVFNVSGTSDVMQSMGTDVFTNYACNILFNFYEAESLSMASAIGSILAPYADITGDYGQIKGTVIAESWTGTTEMHDVPFEGDIPSVPEPGSLVLLFSGLIGLAGLRKRMKR